MISYLPQLYRLLGRQRPLVGKALVTFLVSPTDYGRTLNLHFLERRVLPRLAQTHLRTIRCS